MASFPFGPLSSTSISVVLGLPCVRPARVIGPTVTLSFAVLLVTETTFAVIGMRVITGLGIALLVDLTVTTNLLVCPARNLWRNRYPLLEGVICEPPTTGIATKVRTDVNAKNRHGLKGGYRIVAPLKQAWDEVVAARVTGRGAKHYRPARHGTHGPQV